ncbi:MAG TPA: bleomycin resistance protein [Candidatus Dormibacteraeota bacterium]
MGSPDDVAELADLLRETDQQHAAFEARAPKHDWWDWYAAYIDARLQGSSPEAAAVAAERYMADVKHIVA